MPLSYLLTYFHFNSNSNLNPNHNTQQIMCPPNIYGNVVKVYGEGTDGRDGFTVDDTVLEVWSVECAIHASIEGEE